MTKDLELIACTPHSVLPEGFNSGAILPYGLTTEHIYQAMNEFVKFLGFVNRQLYSEQMPRLESILMPANFSSIVGEFMKMNIPKFCSTLVSNQYPNGHPDLIPARMFPLNSILHTDQGIEIKASRYNSGWQGHNPEAVWLMVFIFDSNRPSDTYSEIPPKPFRFCGVVGNQLLESDWSFSGRSISSRRTITASVTKSGYNKMITNWIYKEPTL